MFSYVAYGLRIQSDIAIAEFPPAPPAPLTSPAAASPQVTIYLEPRRTLKDYLPAQVTNEFGYLKLTRTDGIFYIKHAGLFFIAEGSKIFILPAPDATESLLRFYLVGTVMGILLYQRGHLVLHASAVNINNTAVAFLGISGEGKSSTAAAFQAANYDIITDDVAPITLEKTAPLLIPSFPQIKLSREIATVLGHDFDSLPPLCAASEKRGYRWQHRFSQTFLPIKHIYVLASDSEFGIDPLNHQDAVVELSRHSRPSTLFHKPDAHHFRQCATLAKQCPVYRLKRPRNITLLPELVHQVEHHLSLVPSISA